MKIKFDAKQLTAELSLMRSALPGGKSVTPGDGFIGLRAEAGELVAYASAKGQWVKIRTTVEVLAEGIAILDRTRFFKLLEALRGQTELKTQATGGRVTISTVGSPSKFTLGLCQDLLSRPAVSPEAPSRTVLSEALRDQLKLNLVDGELTGGGYKIKGDAEALSIMASDRLRLVVTKQKFKGEGPAIDLSIPTGAIKGVFQILQQTELVGIRTSLNLIQLVGKTVEGVDLEFGFARSTEAFPDVSKILEVPAYPNIAKFEVGDLLDAITKAGALADDELPFADFEFNGGATCKLTAFNQDGSAEMGLDAPSTVTDLETQIVRMQLPHLKSLLAKAKSCGADWVSCQWGNKLPIRWSFDFEDAEDQKYATIDMVFIMAALNRPKDIELKKEQTA